jgi:hypothetical protein
MLAFRIFERFFLGRRYRLAVPLQRGVPDVINGDELYSLTLQGERIVKL